MNAIHTDVRRQRQARRIAAFGRMAFLAALLLSVVAGAGWRTPHGYTGNDAEQRTASLTDADVRP